MFNHIGIILKRDNLRHLFICVCGCVLVVFLFAFMLACGWPDLPGTQLEMHTNIWEANTDVHINMK